MIWLVALESLVAAQSAEISTVSRFLTLVREEPSAASAMLTEDATVAFGDVGFPLTVDVFQKMSEMGCAIQGRLRPYEPAPGAADTPPAVIGDLICVDDQSRDASTRPVIFVIEGQKIAGVLFLFGGGEAGRGHHQSSRQP